MQQFGEIPKNGNLHGPAVSESARLAAAGIAHKVGRVRRCRLDPEFTQFGS